MDLLVVSSKFFKNNESRQGRGLGFPEPKSGIPIQEIYLNLHARPPELDR